jgi:hypothetical protein
MLRAARGEAERLTAGDRSQPDDSPLPSRDVPNEPGNLPRLPRSLDELTEPRAAHPDKLIGALKILKVRYHPSLPRRHRQAET